MTAKVQQIKSSDPAGADQVVIRAAQACVEWGQRLLHSKFGVQLDFWSGSDGLGSVVEQAVREQGIPNKRFHEIVNPRVVAERAGVIRMPKRRLKK